MTVSGIPLFSDKIIHERARLLVLTALAAHDRGTLSFGELREKLDLTPGNLSIQLKTLKNAEYIAITKRFKDDKPLTTARITERGRKALNAYLAEMERLIRTLK